MFNPKLGEQNQERKQRALAEIKKFGVDWEMAHVIFLPSGEFLVERLDEQNEQIGVYGFNNRGELNSFDISGGPSKLNALITNLAHIGIKAEVIDLKRQRPKSAGAVK